jgi:hypothetical protein
MLPVSLLLHPTSATKTAAVNKHFFIRVFPLLLNGEVKGLHQASPFETPQTRIAPSFSIWGAPLIARWGRMGGRGSEIPKAVGLRSLLAARGAPPFVTSSNAILLRI